MLLTRQESDASGVADAAIDAESGEEWVESILVRRGPVERKDSAPGCLGTDFKEGARRSELAESD